MCLIRAEQVAYATVEPPEPDGQAKLRVFTRDGNVHLGIVHADAVDAVLNFVASD